MGELQGGRQRKFQSCKKTPIGERKIKGVGGQVFGDLERRKGVLFAELEEIDKREGEEGIEACEKFRREEVKL